MMGINNHNGHRKQQRNLKKYEEKSGKNMCNSAHATSHFHYEETEIE